jgi:hypothetical protein
VSSAVFSVDRGRQRAQHGAGELVGRGTGEQGGRPLVDDVVPPGDRSLGRGAQQRGAGGGVGRGEVGQSPGFAKACPPARAQCGDGIRHVGAVAQNGHRRPAVAGGRRHEAARRVVGGPALQRVQRADGIVRAVRPQHVEPRPVERRHGGGAQRQQRLPRLRAAAEEQVEPGRPDLAGGGEGLGAPFEVEREQRGGGRDGGLRGGVPRARRRDDEVRVRGAAQPERLDHGGASWPGVGVGRAHALGAQSVDQLGEPGRQRVAGDALVAWPCAQEGRGVPVAHHRVAPDDPGEPVEDRGRPVGCHGRARELLLDREGGLQGRAAPPAGPTGRWSG